MLASQEQAKQYRPNKLTITKLIVYILFFDGRILHPVSVDIGYILLNPGTYMDLSTTLFRQIYSTSGLNTPFYVYIYVYNIYVYIF